MKYPKLMKYPKRWKYQFFGSCYFPYRKLWWTVIGGSPKRFSEKSIPNFWPFPSQLLVEKIALFCWWFGTWLLFSPLVVWNMAFIFPNSWDDDPIWLSLHHFSEGGSTTNQPCFCSSTFKFSWDFYLRTYRINLDSGGFAQKKTCTAPNPVVYHHVSAVNGLGKKVFHGIPIHYQ